MKITGIHLRLIFLTISMVGLVSCANQTEEPETSAESLPSLSQRLEESSGFKQDEGGNWVPTNNKRSSFEQQAESAYSKGEFDKKTYETGDYKKQSWWGKKDHQVKSYEGYTDGSRFQTAADLGQKNSNFGTQGYATGDPYQTNRLEYQAAREASGERMARPSNQYQETQQQKFTPPAVMDWKEQRKLSMEQSKSILGR